MTHTLETTTDIPVALTSHDPGMWTETNETFEEFPRRWPAPHGWNAPHLAKRSTLSSDQSPWNCFTSSLTASTPNATVHSTIAVFE